LPSRNRRVHAGLSRAGRHAPADLVLNARPFGPVLFELLFARGKRECTPNQGEQLPHPASGYIGAVVERTVLLQAPDHIEARILGFYVETEVGIVLVVPEDDVVARMVLLDQGGLKDERLELGVGHDGLEVGDLADQHLGFFSLGPLLKIRAHPAPEGKGLAHIDNVALSIFHEVDARRIRQVLEFFFEGHGEVILPRIFIVRNQDIL